VRGRVRSWLARWLRTDPFEASDFRPRIRFGPESAVTSSPASWVASSQPRSPSSQLRSPHPSYGPRDREDEYARLQSEIAHLAHPDDRPPTAGQSA
jgi:hypothetical protein